MTTYEQLLANAPEHDTPEFIEYLREHNRVVRENDEWLVIENIKYHRPTRRWYTAFSKKDGKKEKGEDADGESPGGFHFSFDYRDNKWLHKWYKEWNWLKKAASKQTVKRYHFHIFEEEKA